MYFVNPDYIAQVFLESQPRVPKNKRRVAKVESRTSTTLPAARKAPRSRLWAVSPFRRAFG